MTNWKEIRRNFMSLRWDRVRDLSLLFRVEAGKAVRAASLSIVAFGDACRKLRLTPEVEDDDE